MNTLTEKFETLYSTVPFSKIKNEEYLPAIKHLIKKTKKEIEEIANNRALPTFKNTIEALEYSGHQLDRVSSLFFNLNSAETNDEIQKIAQQISPLLSEFSNDVILNEKLFNRIKTVYNNQRKQNLNQEQIRLLERKFKRFSRNGADLQDDKKERLRKIDKQLSKLSLKFGENVLAETNKYEMLVSNESDLAGLPKISIESAKLLAESKNKKGWLFTLDYPSYIPFMKYADNRKLREELFIAFSSKGFKNDDLDNQQIVLDIVKLRHQRANLLGYDSHAHFVLEERMAENPEKVMRFLNKLLQKAKPAAKKEFEKIQNLAQEWDGLRKLEKWDAAYYSEKLKQKLYDLDDEKLKPYFKLENVIQGVFSISNKLFGLSFQKINNIDRYHEDVTTYKVLDENGEFLSILYADFFPRPGKRNGAWMTSYKPQYIRNGKMERPHVSIVCNFSKPTKNTPSLLSFTEVRTLFHEFGHALHGMLANTTYPSLSGTNVYWDFVELPSQILENWCYEKDALELFANHYQTDETIPMDLINKIKESSTFNEGLQTLRQISFGLLDMSYHSQDPSHINDVKQHEIKAFENTQLYPEVKETCMSTAFAHIFQGGYSSGYYSYKWAEVLDADAYQLFKEKGIFDKKTAKVFKDNILSKGGSEDPMALYKRFRGQEPNPDALLKRAGLIK